MGSKNLMEQVLFFLNTTKMELVVCQVRVISRRTKTYQPIRSTDSNFDFNMI